MMDHLHYMRMALKLARRGWGKVSPNPMVGAVLVKRGKVIARGWHAYCGGPHAEAMAIALAGKQAKGADLYVTLEPCGHFGRTPPCVDAIINAHIKRVFVGVPDPNPITNGASLKKLRKAGITTTVGFLKDEITRLNAAFNKHITTGIPYVTAKAAQTIDGKSATLKGVSKWITSEEARDHAHQLRYGTDAILVGINTVLKDNPALNSTPRKRTIKAVLDTRLRMPNKGRIYQATSKEDLLIFTAKKNAARMNASVITTPMLDGKLDLKWVLGYLGKQGVGQVLIEGGPTVVGNALKLGLVDRMQIYIAPRIMGEGLPSINAVLVKDIKDMPSLKRVHVSSIGPDLFIEGVIKGW